PVDWLSIRVPRLKARLGGTLRVADDRRVVQMSRARSCAHEECMAPQQAQSERQDGDGFVGTPCVSVARRLILAQSVVLGAPQSDPECSRVVDAPGWRP